jgi:hypothetical protein
MSALAMAVPGTTGFVDACGMSAIEASDADLRRDCLAVAGLMADDGVEAIRGVGLRAQARWLGDGPDAIDAADRLRANQWLAQRAAQLSNLDLERPVAAQAWFDDWLAWGEVGANQRLLQRHGVSLEPPTGWIARGEGLASPDWSSTR